MRHEIGNFQENHREMMKRIYCTIRSRLLGLTLSHKLFSWKSTKKTSLYDFTTLPDCAFSFAYMRKFLPVFWFFTRTSNLCCSKFHRKILMACRCSNDFCFLLIGDMSAGQGRVNQLGGVFINGKVH